MIQNAEDNHYSKASALGAEPYIKFIIRPGTITIECNEDGFTPDNVRAICRIGESTKIRANSQYYIGEKGIGFKSVFMVASKVHIQSGPFSFFFEHEPGNNGMGLITPIWEPRVILAEPLTRITLTLLDSLDLSDILSQFNDLPDTLLLFMKKLRKIVIDQDVPELLNRKKTNEGSENDESDGDDDGDGSDEESNETSDDEDEPRVKSVRELNAGGKSFKTYSCLFDDRIGRAQVFTSTDEDEVSTTCCNTYRIARKTMSNLPAHTQRDYNTAEVVLAFPIINDYGAHGDPKHDQVAIAAQEVYAFLPIRDFGYPVSATKCALHK